MNSNAFDPVDEGDTQNRIRADSAWDPAVCEVILSVIFTSTVSTLYIIHRRSTVAGSEEDQRRLARSHKRTARRDLKAAKPKAKEMRVQSQR